VADPNKIGLVSAVLIGGWHVVLPFLNLVGLGAADSRFHFLGAHDKAGILR
jgi:hypothetical protein